MQICCISVNSDISTGRPGVSKLERPGVSMGLPVSLLMKDVHCTVYYIRSPPVNIYSSLNEAGN